MTTNKSYLVYVGSYTHGGEDGIHIYRMDPDSGELTLSGSAGGPPNPSFLAIHPSGRFLAAVNETGEFAGQPGGGVTSYAIDPASGALTLLNSQLTHGAAPCYVSFDPTGRWVLVANFGSGSLATFPIAADGRLGPAAGRVQHQGPDPAHPGDPHAHSILPLPGGQLFASADLGLDRVFFYHLQPDGNLAPARLPFIQARHGAGPRHLACTAGDGQQFELFVINELDSTVAAYRCAPDQGLAAELQVIPTRPVDFNGPHMAADLHLDPAGRFLYASDRGDSHLAVYAVDPGGNLAPVGRVPTGGRIPRNFAIDPDGIFLLAANQESDTIVTFRIDPQTGLPAPTGAVTAVSKPVCVVFYH